MATAADWLVEQLGGGMPGSGVTCQQATNPLRKVHSSAARITSTPIMINWVTDGPLNVRILCTRVNILFAIFYYQLTYHLKMGESQQFTILIRQVLSEYI